jgi:hypothetical protein
VTSARITRLLLLCGLALTLSLWCVAQQAQNQSLLITIQQTSAKPTLCIDLQNVGKEPLHLYLGEVLGNGNQILAVDLSLADDKGKTIPLVSKVIYIAGRVDPIMMSLAPGNSYSFQIDLADFSKGGDYVSLSLATGRYTLNAVYTGRDYRAETGFWKGTVTSNALPFTIPAR